MRMSKSYSVADARAHLPEILDAVEAGGEVRLTRRGRPVAVVVSAHQYEVLQSGQPNFAEAYRAFLDRHPVGDLGLEVEFFDSLRDRGPGRGVRL
jgi:prevent-host-death family protein